MKHLTWARRAALAAAFGLVALLGACGGGGGGGSDGRAMQVSFDASSLSLETTEGFDDASGIKVLNASASGGNDTDKVYVGAILEGQGIQPPVQVNVDVAPRTATITARADSTLPAGTYTGQLRLLACRDSACHEHLGGSPHIVNFTTTIKPRLKASTSSLALAAP